MLCPNLATQGQVIDESIKGWAFAFQENQRISGAALIFNWEGNISWIGSGGRRNAAPLPIHWEGSIKIMWSKFSSKGGGCMLTKLVKVE